VLRQLAPDYVDLINPHPKSYAALVGTSQKIVGEWDEPPTMKQLGVVKDSMFAFLDRWLRRRAVVRIACTLFIQEWFRQKYDLPTAHIPHAPYLANFPDGESPFAEPTAVYMGNLFPLWDHDIVLEAARILKRRGETPKILLMGGGPDLDRWKTFVEDERLDNVTLAGFVSGEDLWRRLRHAHVLLFPIRPTVTNRSRCPSKVFAYAQSRRPIITSRTGELPFMLGEGPESPIYIESTADEFADAIGKVMSEPRRPDVDYHVERHSWDARADRLIEVVRRYERGEDPYR
jgi:glycosyltransferase involved in cell wall biosynthesis